MVGLKKAGKKLAKFIMNLCRAIGRLLKALWQTVLKPLAQKIRSLPWGKWAAGVKDFINRTPHAKPILCAVLVCIVAAAVLSGLLGRGRNDTPAMDVAPATEEAGAVPEASPKPQPTEAASVTPVPVTAEPETSPADLSEAAEAQPAEDMPAAEEEALAIEQRDYWMGSPLHISTEEMGFREGRAWVRTLVDSNLNDGGNQSTSVNCLIDPQGNICLVVPFQEGANEEHPDYGISWNEFHAVENGVTYICGTGEHPTSVILDADGHELCRFVSTDDTLYKIVGRTQDRFLLACVTNRSLKASEYYLIAVEKDGSMAGAPRLIKRDTDALLGPLPAPDDIVDLGEGIFLVKHGGITYGFYNINNNTFQCTHSYHYDYAGKFCNGVTLMCTNLVSGSSKTRYVVSLDELQEDRDNLVLETVDTKGIYSLTQYGSRWVGRMDWNITYVSDQEGRQIPLFDELRDQYSLSFSEDGYVFVTNGASFFVIDPEGNKLYEPQPFADLSVDYLDEGYCLAVQGGREYGIVDRAGSVHSFSEDLSGLPDIDKIDASPSSMPISGGYLIAGGRMFGLDDVPMVIRSLAGETTATHITITDDTIVMGNRTTKPLEADLSSPIPVAWADGAPINTGTPEAATGTVDVAGMGIEGVIPVDTFENVLLFDQDGVTVTLTDFDTMEIVNDNPDNRKIEIYDEREFINGIALDVTTGFNVRPSMTCAAGEAIEYKRSGGTIDHYYGELSELSRALSEVPLEEVTWQFRMRIGSDAEPVLYSRTLRLNSYSEEDLAPLYGNCVGQYTATNGKTLEVYRIHDEKSVIVGVKNLSDMDLSTDLLLGDWCWTVNGKRLDIGYKVLRIPCGSMKLLKLSETEETLRKQLEIPNDDPLDIGLVISTDSGFYLNVVLESY